MSPIEKLQELEKQLVAIVAEKKQLEGVLQEEKLSYINLARKTQELFKFAHDPVEIGKKIVNLVKSGGASIGDKVYIVRKNSDFTEGRGPMLFHKVFYSGDDAIAYVQGKSGIFGSPQKVERNKFGHYAYANGYDIEEVEIN